MKRKAVSTFRKAREIVEVSWNPTWEPEELQYTCESFKQSLNKFEEHITAPNLSQPFFFFFWWGLLHGPQQGPDRMKGKKPRRLGKGKLLPKQKNPP